MTIGKYYKVFLVEERYYFKLQYIKDGKLHPEFFICNNKYYGNISVRFGINDNIYTEVLIDEFAKYLPDWHPDKIFYNRRNKIKSLLIK